MSQLLAMKVEVEFDVLGQMSPFAVWWMFCFERFS